ncbi:GTP pyrophosphokinase [Citrobacter cronae]|uniref:RelA/SpoT domain-containing protein n=1 Tax=Citrobacter cronae TaxID=1748967 RepID=A0A7X1BTM5_9ENTR|nr:RelA/SpoT domain-containing protein [Citrobacter cronae]MBC2622881.1 RelA/SpoT domain-containing protein [Citrobacter cronae]
MSENNDCILTSFLDSYRREYFFYHELAKEVKVRIENKLDESGIKAIVSFRAKSIKSIKDKIEKRNSDNKRKPYESCSDIYGDIVDLSGVRVALYFPAEMEKVSNIIENEFNVAVKKKFPGEGDNKNNSRYVKKFDGYHARHFRVMLKDNSIFANHMVEIQIASVLMHAWSEVEHDLDYKPSSGSLSIEELMILDEINGLVISGNIALERLQQAMLKRIDDSGYIFRNHYDLAAFFSSKIHYGEIINTKEIYNLLLKIDVISKEKVSVVTDKVNKHIEKKRKALDARQKRVSPDGVDAFKSGFLEALITLIISKEWSENVLNLMASGYKAFPEPFKNQDVIFNCLRHGKNKDISKAFGYLWRIRFLGENRFDDFDLRKFDMFFEPVSESITKEDAIESLEDLIDALKVAGTSHFNADSVSEIDKLAKVVNEKIKIKKTD